MYFNNLLPTLWRKSGPPMKGEEENPFADLQQEINRVFENFFKGFDIDPFQVSESGFGKYSPSIDVKESEKEILITAELPGMDEKDFEILLTEGMLTIKGEKKEEKEDRGRDFYRMERSYGCFNRAIPLPEGLDTSRVDAKFKSGVLRVTLPKTEESKSQVKKIPIKMD